MKYKFQCTTYKGVRRHSFTNINHIQLASKNETSSAYPLVVCVLFSLFKTSLVEFIVSQTLMTGSEQTTKIMIQQHKLISYPLFNPRIQYL